MSRAHPYTQSEKDVDTLSRIKEHLELLHYLVQCYDWPALEAGMPQEIDPSCECLLIGSDAWKAAKARQVNDHYLALDSFIERLCKSSA